MRPNPPLPLVNPVMPVNPPERLISANRHPHEKSAKVVVEPQRYVWML